MATSPDGAASMLARATGLMDPADPGRDFLLVEQAGGLMWAGRLGEVEAVCRALLARDHDLSVTPAARICLAHALLAGGRAGEALRELDRAAGSATPASAELATARAHESFARLSLGDLDGAWSAAAAAQSADSPACGHQDTTAAMTPLVLAAEQRTSVAMTPLVLAAEQRTSVAMTSQALAAQLRGDLSLALQIADDTARRADRSPGRLGHRYPVLAARGAILIELDRLDEARSTLQAGMRLAEELGVQLHLPPYQVYLAFERFTAGDWDEALAQAQIGLELAEEVGETYARVMGQAVRSLILVHRNDLPGARAAALAAEAELSGAGPRYRSDWAQWARALILEADGQAGQAYAVLARC